MKKFAKIWASLFLAILACLVLVIYYFGVTKLASVEEVRQQLEGKILSKKDADKFDTLSRFFNSGDTASAVEMIVSNNFGNRIFFHKLVKQSLYYRFIESPDSAVKVMDVASKIARIYEERLNDSFLNRELVFCLSLSDEELKQKMTAELNHAKGGEYYSRSIWDSAKVFLDKSLLFSRKLEDKKLIADNLVRIQYILWKKEYLQDALQAGQEIIEIADEIGYLYRKEKAFYSNSYIHRKLGYHRQAVIDAENALKIAELIGDRDFIESILKEQGKAYFRLGKNEKALNCFAKVAEIAKNKNELEKVYILNLEIANVYIVMGEYRRAQELLESALANQAYIEDKQIIAATTNSLGETFFLQGDHNFAHIHLNKALSMFDEIERPYDSATTAMLIGDVYFDENKLAQADSFYTLALEKFFSNRDDEKPQRFEGEIFLSLGDIRKSQGQVESAMKFYEKALRTFEASEFAEGIALSLIRKGHIFREKADFRKALQNLRQAQKIATNIGYPRLHWNALYGIAKTYKDQKHYENANKTFTEAITLIDTTRAYVNEDLKISYFATIQDLYDDMILLQLEHEKDLLALSYSEQSRARMLLDLLLNNFEPTNGYFTNSRHLFDLEDFQKTLDEKTKFIEYKLTNEKMIIFLVSKNQFQVAEIKYSIDQIKRHVFELREAILSVKNANINDKIAYSNSLNKAKKLYGILIEPIEQFLASEDNLVIVPDDALWYLPFSALVRFNGKQDRFLIEDHSIAFAQSATIFKYRVGDEKQNNIPVPSRLFAIANPDGSLPGTLIEVKNISTMFPHADILLEGEVSKERVNTLVNQSDYHVLHFATHSIINEKAPFSSFLIVGEESSFGESLSTHDNGTLKQDNSLTCKEIYNLSFKNVQLVTLSACETAGGRFYRGEGLVGMTHAFMHAGAASLLTSQWMIDDNYTKDIMVAFYDYWLNKKHTKIQALTLAQRSLIDSMKADDVMKYPHPYAWAGFNLIGQYH